MSRKSVLSMRTGTSIESKIPLRSYLLSVGGALILLLFAADWLLPAPLPSRLIESHYELPPIRILSELKGPEAVVIDTNKPVLMPMVQDEEIAAAPSQLQNSGVANAAPASPEPVGVSESSPTTSSTTSRVDESVSQLGPAIADQAGPSRRRGEIISEPQRRYAHLRSGKRRRPPRASIPRLASAIL